MLAIYNWATGRYEDQGKEVSWGEVEKQYGLKQEQEPKSKDQERQDALNSWNKSLLGFNDLMNNVMQFLIFAEGFAEMSPLTLRKFVAPKGSLTIEAGGGFFCK